MNIIIKQQTTKEKAMESNGVLMVGRIKNRRELAIENSTNTIPTDRFNKVCDFMHIKETKEICIQEDEDYGIPEFLIRYQEERKRRMGSNVI